MILYLVRHGETDFNKARRLQGREVDGPLNAEGVRQARELSEHLPGDFDVILSSPLLRARMTAEIIRERFPKPLIVRKELEEKGFGSLSGKTWAEIEALAGAEIKEADRDQRWDYRAFGGESVADVEARLRRLFDELKAGGEIATAVGVTHGGILRLLYKMWQDKDVWEIENATVHRFEI